MSKLTKRLLCIGLIVVLTVALGIFVSANFTPTTEDTQEPVCYEHGDVNGDGKVDNKDAIYIMYSYMFGDELFHIEQAWDYNKDTQTDNKDAIYVMYHYMFEDNPAFGLNGTIHSYYDPTWAWDSASNTAQVTFKCGCGTPCTYTAQTGVTVTAGEVVAASCVDAGSETYVASITVDGNEYTNTYIKTLPAGTGHSMSGDPDCLNGSACSLCDYSLPALGHSWTLEETRSATCNANAVAVYRCSTCQATDEVEQAGTAGHTLGYLEDRQDGCKYVKWYKCANCDHTEAGTATSDTYYNHTYTATLTKEATCVSYGEKTYVCECGVSYKEDIPANDSHNWVEGATVDGVTTHTCSNSGCTVLPKKTVSVTENTKLSTEALANELQLDGGTSMSLDQDTVAALDENKTVVVSVTPLDEGDELLDKLTSEQKEQIGTNTVYDFNMAYSDGSAISEFAGAVTISLPYKLEEGEDVDSIDVWYIDDNGTATQVTGTYSNGFVTFTTTHFSYYTVTRLTPAERCSRYGHILVSAKKAATCTQDGFDMSVCQRCGHVEKDEVLTRLGHDYTQTTVAATCTEAGSFEKVCTRSGCSHKVTGVIPALRHDMQKDDAQAVEASCTTAGKTVYVCSHEGCEYKIESATAQLSHNYETVEVKAADCANKGYTEKKCTLCEDTTYTDETLPLGHTYAVSGWNWASDHLSAELTLVCTNDESHIKTLSAVVTQKKDSASCMGSGAVTFTATASFNQVSYTDTYTQTTAAIGHKPGTKWESDGNRHYHICSVCSEPVDAVNHTWNDGTVTKEPTCNTAGSATYQCTVCQYEKEKTLPATKAHDYVNGVCSTCGKEETGCIHDKVTASEVDLTGWDVCENTQITKYSCDCGENVYYDWNLPCNFPDESETKEIIDYNGQQVVKLTRFCPDCGLSMSYFQFVDLEEDACVGCYAVCYIINVTGQEPLVGIHKMTSEQMHPGITMQPLSLEEYGLCGEVLAIQTCGCEEQVVKTTVTDSCNWEYAGKGDTYICADCGAKKTSVYDYKEPTDDCFATESITATYYVDDVQVYTFTNNFVYAEHNYEATSWELLGETCDDGVLYEISCAKCGATRTVYDEYHETVIQETLDLSDAAICYDEVVLSRCACEENYQYYYLEGDTQCSWQWVDYDEETGTDTYVCRNCNAVRTWTQTESEKNENCVYVYENIYQFTDADGTLLFTGVRTQSNTEHDYAVEYTMTGKTCEDGVFYKKTCVDCGAKNNYTSYGHGTFKKESYNTADYGLCGGTIEIWGCPCGYQTSSNFKDNCQWEYYGGMGDEGFEQNTFFCAECNSYYNCSTSWSDTEDPCLDKYVYTYKFYENFEDPQELFSFSYTRLSEDHDILTAFKLNNSELGCEGGYTVINSCQNCDHTETWDRTGDSYHETYLIAKDTYSSDKLCGDIFVYSYSCACGYRASEDYNLWENGCDWMHMDSTSNGYWYQCQQCGTKCTVTYSNQKVEGESCKLLHVRNIVFINADEELFSFDLCSTEFNHRYVYTFELEGTTCSDGYYAYGTCLDCGETTQDWSGGCSTYPIERQLVADDPAACDVVDLVHYSCPCGTYSHQEISSGCNWQWEGYDENGADMYTCSNCSMKWTELQTSQRIPGTCQYQVTRTGELTLSENSYSYEITYTEFQHRTVYSLTLLGETCTDGVQVTRGCAYCDYVGNSWTNYDHSKYLIEYYDLADYGMCGGYISHSTCGCGQESSWGWNVNYCDGRSTGKIDPDTGDTEYFCMNCQSYYSWGNDGVLNTDTCCFEGEFYFKLRNAEETLINVRGATSREEHTTHAISQELLNPEGDCDDGVKRYWQCQYCDEGWYSTSYGHGRVETDRVNAGCGGKVYVSSCACGKNIDVYEETNSCSMTHEYYSETDENGIVHEFTDRSCESCGLNILHEWYRIPGEGCAVEETHIYTVTGGDVDKIFTYTEERTLHQNVSYSSTLAPGAESCDDGTIVTEYCSACGYSDSWYSSGHSTYVMEDVYLTKYGACSGELQIRSCACGQEQEMSFDHSCYETYDSWETTGENGVVYEFELWTCTECGLKKQTVRHKEATDTLCLYTYYTNTTVSVGDGQWSVQSMYKEHDHEYKVTYSLLEGSVTCSDGVLAEERCAVCGKYDSWTTSSHYQNVAESVDISQYSSVCGGSLDIYQCPCGYSTYSRFNGDTCCDFDNESISVWIEDAVYEYNPCIDGNWQTSYATLYRCAVTDPEVCGLVIRKAEYSLKSEGCYVTNYVTWQIGYDAETDTCLREITYQTGKKQFHNYTVTSLDSTAEDGSSTSGKHYVCADCQSEYYYKYEYDTNGELIRSENYYRNTLNDGNDQYRRNLHTYQIIDGVQYNDTERSEVIYADGSEFWYQYIYTYDAENCRRTEVYTNSRGASETNDYEWHQSYTAYSDDVYATCSQPGHYHRWDVCNQCGKTTWESSWSSAPGHCWHWDSGLNTYYCCDCGLYCASGADGDIIMEDLTEEYGNGTDYVVGYYNPNAHMFVANVSVILDNAESEDNQIDLGITDITYYTYEADGFTGLSVDKALTDAAAAEAVAALGDYEGTYAIRISFVPISSHFTLDYGITFDSVTAE